MSKARLVITAVVVEGRSQSEVAFEYGVSQGWVSRLVARYRLEGEAAFQPRSRRPHTTPTRLAQDTIELIIELREKLASKGLDNGPYTIAWHLQHRHGCIVSAASIYRHLRAAGLIAPHPHKRPKSSYIRFAAEQPNERWQADFTHWWLADHSHVEILDWLDDHARYVLSLTAHLRITGPIVLDTFRKAYATHGIPASTLTDNGMVFTTRLSGGKGGRNAFENELHRLGVTQINSTPNHPTTCGKVERFHQTLKKWLTGQPRATTLAELQTQLDTFAEEYNHRRPHRSLPHHATPATAYTARPKANPATSIDTHNRVRTDRIDQFGKLTLRHAGRLHHIGVGRTHARTRVLVLVQDLNIRIINATTGELLRQLTLDPTRDYQPRGMPSGRPTKKPKP
ncbi:integrase catalytic subunit [Intrasporangium calvum DSM] [Mycobacterium shimoidei]|uniref:Integrase catalytic subunit [Intrasporangium calvum DSM] n=2 Tax=Mycobacterium shimoidei TaxID=29313 RepID=A0A375Z4E9_MYCSH|nr:IS481 family transposase [Mycobacterium shimoidei]SRX93014.1 integrase catalytic subunit [Intrasporangium calvum DSM] [Mycobacterium shimoidei]SRX95972.1 integrase catalytic subunit [Intrasporangium calvum DSM] [Mycobacterium shimoidei]